MKDTVHPKSSKIMGKVSNSSKPVTSASVFFGKKPMAGSKMMMGYKAPAMGIKSNMMGT